MSPRRAFWAIFATGLILPWIVALAVRTILDLQGKPVMGWDWIGGMLPVFSAMTVLFCLPFLILAYLSRIYLRHAPEERNPVTGWALAGPGAAPGLTAIEAAARQHGRGVWAGAQPAPESWRPGS